MTQQKRKLEIDDDEQITSLAVAARGAALKLQTATGGVRNAALREIHRKLKENSALILEENKKDLEAAAKNNLSKQLIKRLDLSTKDKFESMLQGVLDIEKMEDPVGKTSLATRLDTGLDLFRVACPIGVVLIIFEARPEVVVNIASLAIKSGNAVILKGGKEAQYSNAILHRIIAEALSSPDSNVSKDAVCLVESRTAIDTLLKMDRYVDLVIPRGSNALVRHVQGNTRIPVLGHADGICTTYFDETLDTEMAIRVLIDAKTSYPSACNSTETLLLHYSHLKTPFFRSLISRLTLANIQLRLDASLYNLLTSEEKETNKLISEATEEDFTTEFLDTILAVCAVSSVEDAISHINSHGSHHTDAIITSNADHADQFMRSVDSADVFWNASTRFADGFRFGFGAEIGVSTNKTHARGPVGLEGLLIYKFRLHGQGQCTLDYGVGKKEYLHEKLEVDESKFQL
ncbi:glutamate-5-semialdehyde dehydrogenase [Obelidium mucronatum]|nr:glutamate-5-semialdehyde dehydrogenase [Obelidium mucronatum]